MYEKNPVSHSIETEVQPTEDRWVLISSQMSDILTTPGYGPVLDDNIAAEDKEKQISEWAKDADLDTTLETLGYYEEERTTPNLTLLKLELMTPYFVYAENLDDRGIKKALPGEITEYREALLEAIRANPDTQAIDLAVALQSAVLQSNLPESFRFSSGRIIERALNGARGELIMEQLAHSERAKTAGITYRDTSAAEDARGVDLQLTIPIEHDKSLVNVDVPIDIKFNVEQVASLIKSDEEIKPYVIKDGRVIFWPGTSREDFAGNLLLDQKIVEEKSKKIVPALRRAAEEYYTYKHHRRIDRILGHQGLRSA